MTGITMLDVQWGSRLDLLPLPLGEGWGEGLRSLDSPVTPSPQPSPQVGPQVGRGSPTEPAGRLYLTLTNCSLPVARDEADAWIDDAVEQVDRQVRHQHGHGDEA